MSNSLTRGTVAHVPLGAVVATPGALDALSPHPDFLRQIITRHASQNWGEVDAEDWKANDLALVSGERLLSVYTTPTGTRVWVLTEADRSATTVLLPSEY